MAEEFPAATVSVKLLAQRRVGLALLERPSLIRPQRPL